MDSKFAPPHYNLGMIFRKQQKNEEAAQDFHKALAADPQFRPARQALDRPKSAAGQDQRLALEAPYKLQRYAFGPKVGLVPSRIEAPSN